MKKVCGATKSSGGSRIYKRGGHKIMDLLSLRPHISKITKTTKWEVVKNCASPKRPFFFFFGDFVSFSPF